MEEGNRQSAPRTHAPSRSIETHVHEHIPPPRCSGPFPYADAARNCWDSHSRRDCVCGRESQAWRGPGHAGPSTRTAAQLQSRVFPRPQVPNLENIQWVPLTSIGEPREGGA